MEEANKHIRYASELRTLYKASALEGRETVEQLRREDKVVSAQTGSPASMTVGNVHIDWDFAQSLQLPYLPDQPGAIYFTSPLKVHLFGVSIAGLHQINYLIPEERLPGKGADVVISLLHDFFENHGLNESSLTCCADNTVSQTKNNAMMHYLSWRVRHGLHETIQLRFLAVGHTKFSPDGHFGIIKQIQRRTATFTLDDIKQMVYDSSPKRNVNIPHVEPVSYRSWSSFLAKRYRPITEIASFQLFELRRSEPDTVFLGKTGLSNEELIRYSLLKPTGEAIQWPGSHQEDVAPLISIESSKFNLTRRKYLRDHFDRYIPESKKQFWVDEIYPKPEDMEKIESGDSRQPRKKKKLAGAETTKSSSSSSSLRL